MELFEKIVNAQKLLTISAKNFILLFIYLFIISWWLITIKNN